MNLDPDELRLNLPATNKYLNVIGACLDAYMARIEDVVEPRVTAYNIQLAVNEIVANIIAHAYTEAAGGRIDMVVRLISNPRRLLIDLFDTGVAFDPTTAAEPDLEDVQIHGYGLFLAHNLLDDVTYIRQSDGNNWHLIKYL